MKILIYHMRFHPDLTGTAPLVTQMAVDFAKAGHHVTVVASLPHYGRTEVDPDFHRSGLFQRTIYDGVNLIRTPVFVPAKPTTFLRVVNYLSYSFFSVWAGLFAGPTDVVLAVNPPITTSFSAWLAALWHWAPLVVGIQDIWPEVLVKMEQLSNRALIKLLEWLERIQYRLAKCVVVLSNEMRSNLIGKGVAEEKLTVISNWADLAQYPLGQSGADFRSKHGLQDQFLVLFSGNLGYAASLQYSLEAAKLLQHEKDILFLIVGEGSVKQRLVTQAEQNGLDNVQFLTTQPQEDFPGMLAAADVGLIPLKRSLGQLSVPSKTFTVMASSKPILAAVPADSEIKRLVEEAKCGLWAPPDDPEAIAQAILQLRAAKKTLSEMGQHGRRYLEQRLTRASQTDAYLSVLREAVTIKG